MVTGGVYASPLIPLDTFYSISWSLDWRIFFFSGWSFSVPHRVPSHVGDIRPHPFNLGSIPSVVLQEKTEPSLILLPLPLLFFYAYDNYSSGLKKRRTCGQVLRLWLLRFLVVRLRTGKDGMVFTWLGTRTGTGPGNREAPAVGEVFVVSVATVGRGPWR